MMAKNVEPFIGEAIKELQKEKQVPWELIIVEDHSDDQTFHVAETYAAQDSRIILKKNPYQGKVLGTNYGFSLSSGEIIKCIDSDDVLMQSFFKEYESLMQHDAHCHSAYIVDEKLDKLGIYNVNTELLHAPYSTVIGNLISLPKWSWSFKRNMAEKIFPMPENLPFEDVWMSILIKKNATSFYNMHEPYYLYRQHGNQTFGGILNYTYDRVKFRANRLITLINIIRSEQAYLIKEFDDPFTDTYEYLQLQVNKAGIISILQSKQAWKQKVKLTLILHFPGVAILATKVKWHLDKK
jgi:glycosyltransferase involved in cell wall biosynthesis